MTAAQLRDLILENDEAGIKVLLSPGSSNVATIINSLAPLPTRSEFPTFQPQKNVGKNTVTEFSALHYAVINLFSVHIKGIAPARRALRICKLLLRKGANPAKETKNVWVKFAPPRPNLMSGEATAIKLLDFLAKQHSIESTSLSNREMFTILRSAIETATNDWISKTYGTDSVPLTASKLLANFRLCTSNDIMTFVCSDGVKISAHRSVLSLYSLVFKTFFDGPWSDTHPSGEWETVHTSERINAILDYIYVNKVDEGYTAATCEDLYKVAREFQLTSLIDIAKDYLSDTLTCDNVKETIRLAHLHDDEDLLDICFDFVEANLKEVMLEPSFAYLVSESPELWEKMFAYLQPEKTYSKYTPKGCETEICEGKGTQDTEEESSSEVSDEKGSAEGESPVAE
jgi:BTB/POZ domain/Ankyrin repeat